jgi:hypothetical protein
MIQKSEVVESIIVVFYNALTPKTEGSVFTPLYS